MNGPPRDWWSTCVIDSMARPMFAGVNTLEPIVLESEETGPELRLSLARRPKHHGTKLLKVHLISPGDAYPFMALVMVKTRPPSSRASLSK